MQSRRASALPAHGSGIAAVPEDTTRELDTDGLEELRVPMTKDPKLDELTDLSHLLAAALLKTRRQ